MKECNYCKANCHPQQITLQSNAICWSLQKDLSMHKFNMKDCISKITISDSKSEIVSWFLNHSF